MLKYLLDGHKLTRRKKVILSLINSIKIIIIIARTSNLFVSQREVSDFYDRKIENKN